MSPLSLGSSRNRDRETERDPLGRETEVYRSGVSGPAYITPQYPLVLLSASLFCLLSFPFGSSCGIVISIEELDTLTIPSHCRRMDLH